MKKYRLSIILVCFLVIPLTAHQAFPEDKIDKASKLSRLEGFAQQADKLLQEAIMDDPTNPKVHFRAGEVYFNMNFERQGDQAFRNALQLDSNYGPRIGQAYHTIGQKKTAEQ